MMPVSFNGHAGWLHDAPGAVGVVLCGAQGYEELCTQRGWYELAQSLAARGFPTLRFDYAGCGDSNGSDMDPARVAAWQDSVAQAVAFMRQTLGLRKIVLAGLRLGALLAAQHACTDPAIAGLALLGAPMSGRTYVREMQILASVVGVPPEDAAPWPPVEDGFELGGFLFSDATMRGLANLPRPAALLQQLEDRPCLVLAKGQALAAEAARGPARHVAAPFEGYDGFMVDCLFSKVPNADWQLLGDWLVQHWPPVPDAAVVPCTVAAAEISGPHYCERPAQFGAGHALAGILCTPAKRPAKRVFIIANTGSNHHIGWGRGTVELARRLAGRGMATLRMDLAGLGNSGRLVGHADPPLYTLDAVADITAALDWLGTQGFGRFGMIGTCSGAYLALHASRADARLEQAVMINLNRFFWPDDASIEHAVRNFYRSNRTYARKAADPRTLLRLVKGEIAIGGIARTLASRAGRKILSLYRKLADHVSLPDFRTNAPRQLLGQLSQSGARLLFVYGSHDGGLDEIEQHFGSPKVLQKLRGVFIAKVPDVDHNFSPAWSRQALFAIVESFLAEGEAADTIDAPLPQP